MPDFVCTQCQRTFSVSDAALAKYPGWTPKVCLRCKPTKKKASAARTSTKKSGRGSSRSREMDLPVAEVLERFTEGPDTGIFTDGAAEPNPGPGGWGAVYVVDGEIENERWGHDPATTNNRMELTALIAGYRMAPDDEPLKIYSDSQLCVNTINSWAAGWAKNGWKRKTGEIKNLDLVKTAYELALEKPKVQLVWIQAHSGFRWNEYADSLATAYRRDTK